MMERGDSSSEERREQDRYTRTKFASLIKTPVVGAVTFPAGAMMFLRSVTGCAAGTTAATFTTSHGARTIKTKLLVAGQTLDGIYIERAIVVTPASKFDILIQVGLDVLKKIAGSP